MKVHFIAIGGSAMHNLALALQKKGYIISGSDDEIFEPSKSRLLKAGLLPAKEGWQPELVTADIDAVIVGMHARNDNPELVKAKELGLKIYSYPEYLYEQTKNKTRVVIGGSHGKTTITSMVIHVLRTCNIKFDFMVGAQLEGFDNMVSFSDDANIAVFEGDEYLSSPIDPRPKFHLYQPHIALISGIAWDHINVFPTFDKYVEQFRIFINKIEPNGSLIYCNEDSLLSGLSMAARKDINKYAYNDHRYKAEDNNIYLIWNNEKFVVNVFGKHNMQNINGAKKVCNLLGVDDADFYKAISTFKGAAKRLQLLGKNNNTNIYLDFAHAPSKLLATVKAVKEHFPDRYLVACMELHTFSSLNEDFMEQYRGTMDLADRAIVYYSPHALAMKKLPDIQPEAVAKAFGSDNLSVYTNSNLLISELHNMTWRNKNLLIMTSGNFDGIDLAKLTGELLSE
jgi:UDP-N-acetylmuramate: L-alanyl-gamma-D-glutamyl-meso-diaminopimelate ligase